MLRTNPHSLRSCLCFRVLRLNFDTTDQMAEWYKAPASGSVDLGFNYKFGQPMTLQLVFKASLLDAQHQRDSVKNKPASLLVVLLGKALRGIPPS